MSRTTKFMYNSVATAVYQVCVMIVGIITPRVLLSAYGSEINGLVSSINQFITYFSLVEAGIAGAAVYALYRPLAEEDQNEINAVVSASRKFYIQAGYLFTAMVTGLAILYPVFVKTARLSPLMMGILVLVLGSKGFLEFFTLAKYRVLLTADQRTYVVSLASTVYIVLQMLIIVVLTRLHCNIVLVYTVAIAALLARSLILMIYVRTRYHGIDYSVPPKTQALDKRWDALFLQILQAVQTGAPVILATVFTTLTTVSVYSVFNMVLTGINGILAIFINGLSAAFGDIIVRKEKETLQKSFLDFEWAYDLLIGFVYAVSFLMIQSFVDIYTTGITDANYHQPLIGFLFVLNGLLYNIKTPQGMLVISAGLYKETRWQTLTQALIIVVGGAVLAPVWGIVGILIASCLSNLYRCIDLMIFIPKQVTHLPVSVSFRRALYLMIATGVCILPVEYFRLIPTAQGYLQWILYALPVCLWVCAVMLAVGFLAEPRQMCSILKRLKEMAVKKK